MRSISNFCLHAPHFSSDSWPSARTCSCGQRKMGEKGKAMEGRKESEKDGVSLQIKGMEPWKTSVSGFESDLPPYPDIISRGLFVTSCSLVLEVVKVRDNFRAAKSLVLHCQLAAVYQQTQLNECKRF